MPQRIPICLHTRLQVGLVETLCDIRKALLTSSFTASWLCGVRLMWHPILSYPVNLSSARSHIHPSAPYLQHAWFSATSPRWSDLGLDEGSQQRHLRGLADGVIRICSRELRGHAGSRARLQHRRDELISMAAALVTTT